MGVHGELMNIYEKILAQAEDRAGLRMTAATKRPLTVDMVSETLSYDSVSRPTEYTALSNLRDELHHWKPATHYAVSMTVVQLDDLIKTCRKCGVDKPHMDFSPKRDSSDGLHSYCKHCRAQDARKAA